jgi:hypothetical protein
MTDVAAPPAPAASTAQPATPAMPANMTGAEAVAWVESQKASKGRDETGKFTAGKTAPPAKEPTITETIKEAAAEAKRKLKVDDAEIDEDEVIKVYRERKGHQREANKILQEGKLARKQAEEFIQMMRDPEKFFEVAQRLGHDPRNLSEKHLAAALEEELLDPRDKELRDAKRRLAAIDDMEKKQKAQVEEQRNAALKAKYAKDYSDQFVAALQEAKLPPTKPMVAEMAKYIARSAKLGFQMTAAEAATLVKEDIQLKTQKLFEEADGDTLIKLLGEPAANKIRKWDTSRVKSPEQGLRTPSEQPEQTRSRREPHPGKRGLSYKEWREYNRK